LPDEIGVEEVTGGCDVDVGAVVLLTGGGTTVGLVVGVVTGGRVGLVSGPVGEAVEFAGGGDSVGRVVTGGSVVGDPVPVGVSVVNTPVPGPVTPEVGRRPVVTFGVGSRTLEMTEPMPLRTELSGSPGWVVICWGVLDGVVVTIPVGARRIPDEVDVLGVGAGDCC
jgi:hypothetical protein